MEDDCATISSSIVKNKVYGTPSEKLQSDRGRTNASGKASTISMAKLEITDAPIGTIRGSYWDPIFKAKWPLSVQEFREILPVALATETDLDRNSHK